MGAILELGEGASQAARGESSPKALLTTRGDLLYVDSTGNPARLAKGSAGTFLGYNATDLTTLTPPGYPIVDLGRSSTPSDTNEHSLLAANAATAGLFAAGVSVKDYWAIRLRGTILNNSGTSSYTTRIRVLYGAYAPVDITSAALTSNATTRPWGLDLIFLIETLGAAGTGTLRVSGQSFGLDTETVVGTGWRPMPANMISEKSAESTGTSSSPALITNAAQDFNVTAIHSNATALMTTALTECIVNYYPQNR